MNRPAERALERLLIAPEAAGGGAGGWSPEWPPLVEEAGRHGVLGLVARAAAEGGRFPPEVLGALRRHAAVQRLMQRHLIAALEEILGAFDRAGLGVVALKGPVLGERLYGDATLRVATDLDFLVTRDAFPAAAAVLAGLGYRAEEGAGARERWAEHHHLKFDRPDSPEVELHFRFTVNFGTVVPSEEFLERARPYRTAGGAPCRVLAAEDELLFLVLHAAEHLFARLAWLYDIKALLGARPDLDWGAVADRARRYGLSRAFGFAARLIAERMEVALPAGALPPGPSRARGAVARALLSAASPATGARAKVLGHLFRAVLCDRLALSAKHLGRQCRRLARSAVPSVRGRPWGRAER